jgi:hypothetical protein
MKRAATEEGLWERLRAGLPEPPRRAGMAAGYLGLYENQAPTIRNSSGE